MAYTKYNRRYKRRNYRRRAVIKHLAPRFARRRRHAGVMRYLGSRPKQHALYQYPGIEYQYAKPYRVAPKSYLNKTTYLNKTKAKAIATDIGWRLWEAGLQHVINRIGPNRIGPAIGNALALP